MTPEKRLAVEIGGTFTDIILFEQNEGHASLRTLKVPSTPLSPEQGVLRGVDQLQADWGDTVELLHGSTVATNAVLERKGFKAALLVTQGFADILEIQRGDKENIYDLFYQRSEAVIPRNMVFPVRERLTHQGEVLTAIREDEIAEVAARLAAEGIQAVGICFLHSYANPVHEQMAKRILESLLPHATVIASADILPQFREYERASTTSISAYIAPVMIRYIEKLQSELQRRSFSGDIMITQSNGGIIPIKALRNEVARTLLSGPAAGVTGAVYMANQAGISDIITFDIGGTSADVCLVNQSIPLVSTENKIDGLSIAVPMLDIATVGAGGGSIAWLDDGHMLRVGPKSAGADPGPACYARGGTLPTITDALVYRGLIRPQHFAGGAYPLDVTAGRTAIRNLGAQLGVSSDEAAEAMVRIIEAHMIQAIRLVSTERGYDARYYTLVAFGGGGALHAVSMAEEIGMNQVLVPRYAGILSSFGLLVADIIRDNVQTRVSLCGMTDRLVVESEFGKLRQRAMDELFSYGLHNKEVEFRHSCDVRYQGQAFELQVDLEDPRTSGEEIAGKFHEVHLKRYGYHSLKIPVEIVNYRLRAIVSRKDDRLDRLHYRPDARLATPEEDKVLINGTWINCLFYNWNGLEAAKPIQGPAVVEESSTTCYIPAGWMGVMQENGSLLLRKEVAPA
ncbi:hydantoinase/oxoprolinase family protein [Paenibacillus sp. S150]|uniref:hydantoinase/oxoprolinase family protein n=1 Tax=Paenibacillus sp. S150 TaxID=2749826 RepID=UPI001C5A3A51|nr:hydantoinase/oxoprolinase family protein [Paenibacillus sp. S150]MBW4083101.1 hydantoinase/oxoprolinase family protein [Paenibacillus sp. S150]